MIAFLLWCAFGVVAVALDAAHSVRKFGGVRAAIDAEIRYVRSTGIPEAYPLCLLLVVLFGPLSLAHYIHHRTKGQRR